MAALVPLADAITRRWGGDEIEPIEAGMGRLGGDHLHEVTVLQRCGQGAEAIVDADALAMIADFRVNAIGEIHSGRPLAQAHHITTGGEHKHLLIKEVFLDRRQIIAAVISAILLPIDELPQPVEALGVSGRR